MIEQDNPWSRVPLNTNQRCEMSPPNRGAWWRGIHINAPATVIFTPGQAADEYGAFALIPLCGFSLVEVPPALVGTPMTIVARDMAGGAVYHGPIRSVTSAHPAPSPPADPGFAQSMPRGQVVGGYFNPNVANLVPLPPRAARYEMVVVLGEAVSNRVVVAVVAK